MCETTIKIERTKREIEELVEEYNLIDRSRRRLERREFLTHGMFVKLLILEEQSQAIIDELIQKRNLLSVLEERSLREFREYFRLMDEIEIKHCIETDGCIRGIKL